VSGRVATIAALYGAATAALFATGGAWLLPPLAVLQVVLGVLIPRWWSLVLPFPALALGVAFAPVDRNSDIDKVGGLLLVEAFLAPVALVLVALGVGGRKLVASATRLD
jgi:EamA domain-containing membrane protein RarD